MSLPAGHDTREIHILERHFVLVFLTSHDHARHPEEDDVGSGDEVVGGVVVLELGVVGVEDAVEERQRPQPRAEPSVQGIIILAQVFEGQILVTRLLDGEFQGFFGSFSDHETAFGQVVGRNLMAPPQLTADAPVLDVLQPVTVEVDIFGGIEFDVAI